MYDKIVKLADITNKKNIFIYKVIVEIYKIFNEDTLTLDANIFSPGCEPKKDINNYEPISIAFDIQKYDLSACLPNIKDRHEVTINIHEQNKTITFSIESKLFDTNHIFNHESETESAVKMPRLITPQNKPVATPGFYY